MRNFSKQYELWLIDCLAEFNQRFSENRTYWCLDDKANPGDIVEFSEAGEAYPHGNGGTNHIKDAVTPWADSPHYVE